MPAVKALSLKSLVRIGCALLLKKPGEYIGSCECGACPSWLWYTLPSGPTLDAVFLLHYQESHMYKYTFQTKKTTRTNGMNWR
jgi:hypothetical protein